MSESRLKIVNKLTITFLVDNSIEWFTKLPPGFTHELPQHIQHQYKDHRIDQAKGVPILDFNDLCCGAHGFSVLIETHQEEDAPHLTLFDTGPDAQSLVRNIKGMRIPIERIERVITSHWHADHTGGLLSFLELLRSRRGSAQTGPGPSIPCVVDVHPDRPSSRGIAPGPTYDKVICALPPDPSFEEIAAAGGAIEKHAEGHAVAGGTVWVSGKIPRITEYETGIMGGMRWIETAGEGGTSGKWVSEPHIMDERYIAIDVAGKGLVLFSACSHAGIVNVVKDALETFSRPIYMIIGGLHLAGPEFGTRVPQTVEFLSEKLKPAPTYILPMHCSGFQTKLALEKAFGEGCVPAGVGHKIEVTGDREHDGRLFPATYSQ